MGNKTNLLARTLLSLATSDREKMGAFIEQKLKDNFNTNDDFNSQAISIIENLITTAQQDLMIKAAASQGRVSEEKIDRLIAEIEKLNKKLDKQ